MPSRWAAVWEESALEVRDVRASRWDCDEAEVMSGVRVTSERWRERVGCCDGRLAMMMMARAKAGSLRERSSGYGSERELAQLEKDMNVDVVEGFDKLGHGRTIWRWRDKTNGSDMGSFLAPSLEGLG
jgi:hypothetical protein